MSSDYNLITILGHTAGGKTSVAAHVAHRLGGEIISADSRQVYRGMDLGTGKDIDDYFVSGEGIPYHLIDIVDAGYEYNVYEFQKDFTEAYNGIISAGKVPVMCGGSGLYIESVIRNYRMLKVPVNQDLRYELSGMEKDELEERLNGYGPLHNVSDTKSRKRLIRAIEIAEYQTKEGALNAPASNLKPLVVGINFDRESRRRRITERLKIRLDQGMIGEVEKLLKAGVDHDKLHYYGLEYKYISMHLLAELTRDQMFSKLNTAIHQFAKRQMTYFRGMERRGTEIRWLDGYIPLEEKVSKIESWFNFI